MSTNQNDSDAAPDAGALSTADDRYMYVGAQNNPYLESLIAKDEIVMVAMVVEAAQYLRCGDVYFELVRTLTPENIRTVPHLDDYLEIFAQRARRRGRNCATYVYRTLAVPPANFAQAVPVTG
jgi:hypothetical protein